MLLSETEDNNDAGAKRRACNIPRAVGDPEHVKKSTARNLGGLGGALSSTGPVHKGINRKMNMHTTEKSDLVIVPKKEPNKGAKSSAEVPEGRTRPKGTACKTPQPGLSARESRRTDCMQCAKRRKGTSI